jgi:hypothetical protein
MSDRFTLTDDHLSLLGRAYVRWEDCETGAPAIDCKRPYGNSNVAGDVARILGWTVDEDEGLTDDQHDRALALHRETLTALQIVLVARDFRPGVYVKRDRYDARSWARLGSSEPERPA